MTDTKELIEKIKAGDTHSFRHLIVVYERLVFNIVFRMVAHATDREDVCQDIFVKIYENLSKFNHEAKLSTWIARIAINTCINSLKKKSVPLFDDCTAEEEAIENALPEKISADRHTVEQDTSQRLQHEISRLPQQYRTILTLFHLEEMSYTEIAQILDMPEGTIKSYLFRARKLLKKRLIDKYEQEELWHANA